MSGRPASSYASGKAPSNTSSTSKPAPYPGLGSQTQGNQQIDTSGRPEMPELRATGGAGQDGAFYDPAIPNYDAYSRMPISRGTMPWGYGYSDPDRLIRGNFATNVGQLQVSFLTNPGTQNLVMRAVSNYYNREITDMSYGKGFIMDAVQSASANGESAWDIIRLWASMGRGAGSPDGRGPGGGGGGGGGGTSSRVTLTNEDQAKALIDQAMSQALGRGATEKERADFLKSLNSAERNNPYVQSISGSTVTTTGGVDPQMQALEYAEAQQGSAEFKAAGDLMSAFVAAIEDPVSL